MFTWPAQRHSQAGVQPLCAGRLLETANPSSLCVLLCQLASPRKSQVRVLWAPASQNLGWARLGPLAPGLPGVPAPGAAGVNQPLQGQACSSAG